MYTLYEMLKRLCENKKVTLAQMCADLDISKSLPTELKMGRTKSISTDKLIKIADYFEVSTDYILGKIEKEKPSDEGELKDVVTVNRNGKSKVYRFSDAKLAAIQSLLDQMQEDDSDL